MWLVCFVGGYLDFLGLFQFRGLVRVFIGDFVVQVVFLSWLGGVFSKPFVQKLMYREPQ